MRYVILGFPNSASTSLEAYLNNQGHDVTRHEMSYKYSKQHIKSLIDGRRVILITKEGKNAYNVNYKEYLHKYFDYDPEIVALEDMKSKEGFPWLNKSPKQS